MSQNNNSYTNGYLDMQLLRFTTAGSVDDGKSTLIGRLLYDSKSIFQDQLQAIEESARRRGNTTFDLAHLTDGLRAEREQGITIDVAYRYFATPKRKFIIADTPGHIQYTRNMVTGASTAGLAIILIDARNGVVEQTLRHSFIASLLRIPQIIVCINKMDLVDYSEEVYHEIRTRFLEFSPMLAIEKIEFLPISALHGDNVVEKSGNMPWFKGGTLLKMLENASVTKHDESHKARFPVQYVIRPQTDEHHDFRGYAGRVEGGTFETGDTVTVLPSGHSSKITAIQNPNGETTKAEPPQSVVISLEDNIDISRGDMIVKFDQLPHVNKDFTAMICWFSSTPLVNRGKYVIKHTTNSLRSIITDIEFKMDINTLVKDFKDKEIMMNDIASVRITTQKQICFDSYAENRNTGSFILIDEGTNETVAAGMISHG